MKAKEEKEKKIRCTVAELEKGDTAWMIIRSVHPTKPIQVTIGDYDNSLHTLMPQRHIEIHEREGMGGKDVFYKALIKGINSLVSANDKCYLTEEAAQEVLDNEIRQEKEMYQKTIKMYSDFVKKHISEFTDDVFKDDDNYNSYVNGCVDTIMFLRNHRYILDRQPEVEGITKFRSFEDDYFYGKED